MPVRARLLDPSTSHEAAQRVGEFSAKMYKLTKYMLSYNKVKVLMKS